MATQKRETVGALVRKMLTKKPKQKTYTMAEILAEVKAKFPESETTAGCVSWYASKLRKAGVGVAIKKSA